MCYPKEHKIKVVKTAIRVGISEARRIFGHSPPTIYEWMRELHEETNWIKLKRGS